MSKPSPIISLLSGQALDSSLYRYAGLRLAKSPSSFLILRSAASGLKLGAMSYQRELPTFPPTAPSKTASEFFAVARAVSVSGVPCLSIEQPPMSISVNLKLCPNFPATYSRTFFASATISGPIPSPGIKAIFAFILSASYFK